MPPRAAFGIPCTLSRTAPTPSARAPSRTCRPYMVSGPSISRPPPTGTALAPPIMYRYIPRAFRKIPV
ncbi:hypothetical protein C2E23DRAFT_843354 [Lenzites betulinus]|nr:hypothetical protein C2E23DRAFT_843354 [Lenzites betulinus]